jgi:Na+-driven multidrug efflux pump
LGKAALAAVGITMPLIFTLISLIVGLSIGFNVIIAQYFGAKDYKNVQRTVDTMNIILFISSAIFTIVGLLLMDNVLTLIKTPADIHVQAIQYLRVYLLGWYSFSDIMVMLLFTGEWAILKLRCILLFCPPY